MVRSWHLLLVAALGGCGDDDARDAAAEHDAAAHDAAAHDAAVHNPQDAGDPPSGLARETAFWDQVAICGDFVESYETIDEMADRADAVIVGRIASAFPGNTVQGDAAEDFYAEVNVQVAVDEILRPTITDPFEMSLILPRAVTREAVAPAIAEMNAALPKGPIVMLLRARTDFEDLYTLIDDKALWTRTTRGELDNPIAEGMCLGHYGDEVREQFLGGIENLDALIEHLRL